MHKIIHNCKVTVSAGLYFAAAFLVLTLPIKWLTAAFISAVIHELFHIAAIRLWKLQIHSIRIGIGGTQIQTEPMSHVQELVCALAGPAGGLTLLLFARNIPRIALCAAFHSLYNLLPIYPSDGGRALRCGAKLIFPDRIADNIYEAIETGFLVCVTLLGVYGSFVLHLGLYPMLIALILVGRKLKMKMSLQTGRTQGTIDVL